jgi:hypothetical protein
VKGFWDFIHAHENPSQTLVLPSQGSAAAPWQWPTPLLITPKTISSDQEKIWELAGSLAMELEEMVGDLGATLEGLHQLAKLAPEFAEGDTEEEDS